MSGSASLALPSLAYWMTVFKLYAQYIPEVFEVGRVFVYTF